MALIPLAANGASWDPPNREWWLSSDDPCEGPWFGITCSIAGEVIGLDLSNHGAAGGTIPTQIGYLTKLTGELSETNGGATITGALLNDNQLSGTLPTEVGRWSAMNAYV